MKRKYSCSCTNQFPLRAIHTKVLIDFYGLKKYNKTNNYCKVFAT